MKKKKTGNLTYIMKLESIYMHMTNSRGRSKHGIGRYIRVGDDMVSDFSVTEIFCHTQKQCIPTCKPLYPRVRALKAAGFAWDSSYKFLQGSGSGSEGALTVRTRWGSPSAAPCRQLHRCSTGGAGRPPAGSSCRHKGLL